MKIEMGESLFYSWLRHVKECQIVQTNWKVSPQWQCQHEDKLLALMELADQHFSEKYGYKVFKKNSSLSQLIQQGECDVVGISIQNESIRTYAVDVAFHESGLNYGSREETVMKVISKSLRTAMCLYGFMGSKDAEIVFASPKINPAVLGDLVPCFEDINNILKQQGFNFIVRIIANDEFNELVLKPILLVSDGVADTSELFLRSYQMFKMFAGKKHSRSTDCASTSVTNTIGPGDIGVNDIDGLEEMKIGMIVRTMLKKLLEDGTVAPAEIELMQTKEYSKETFDIQYPLLLLASDTSNKSLVRYYSSPITIHGSKYFLCSEWFESPANNDRPFLMKWLAIHLA